MHYGTEAGFNLWLDRLGLTPSTEASTLSLLNRATLYIDSTYGARFKGERADGIDQALAWPRSGVELNGVSYPDDQIPMLVEQATYRAAYLASSRTGGLSILSDPTKRVKRQKVDGAVEREFFDDGGEVSVGSGGRHLIDTEIEGLLAPLLRVEEEVLNEGMQFFAVIGR